MSTDQSGEDEPGIIIIKSVAKPSEMAILPIESEEEEAAAVANEEQSNPVSSISLRIVVQKTLTEDDLIDRMVSDWRWWWLSGDMVSDKYSTYNIPAISMNYNYNNYSN